MTQHTTAREAVSPVRYEDGAYTWSSSEDGETKSFSTNKVGRGLWMDGKQILGTSQFNLADCAASTRRSRVLRFMAS